MSRPPQPPRPNELKPQPRPPSPRPRTFYPLLFVAIFAALLLLHLPVIDLPYQRDEAGHLVPAALGFHVWVARAAMLAVSAAALAGLFRLGERVSNRRVAAATVLCTALYPVFFAQSALAHPDMAVAALTLWALALYLPPRSEEQVEGRPGAKLFERPGARRALSVALLALACLAKETAILVPLVLCGWELLCRAVTRREKLAAVVCLGPPRTVAQTLALLVALAPLAVWFAYHYAETGYVFGDHEYVRHHVGATLNPARILEAVWRRLAHVTAHMNLWALTGAAALAMFLKPRRDGGAERPRIAVNVQLLFAALVFAHVFALSVFGGAAHARHMLPVVPLVVLVSVSTVWRRVRWWLLIIALVCGAFAYRDFALLYRDDVRLIGGRAVFFKEGRGQRVAVAGVKKIVSSYGFRVSS